MECVIFTIQAELYITVQKPQVTKNTVRIVKEMLFKGRKQSTIHAVTKVSQATISRIKAGDAHPDVPWPDGSVGAIPSGFSNSITEVDWSSDAKRYLTFPEEMQVRILQVVNKKRADIGLIEIPPIALTYKQYLEEDEEESSWEAASLEDARKSEDSRISILMTEFDELVEEENAIRKDEDTRTLFSQTRRERLPIDEKVRTPPKDLKYEKMSIEEILSIDPRNLIAHEAIAMKDPFFLEATCILYKQNRLQVDGWRGDVLRSQIYTLAERLKGYPDVVKRIGND